MSGLVLAIDPGKRTGWALFDGDRLAYIGSIKNAPGNPWDLQMAVTRAIHAIRASEDGRVQAFPQGRWQWVVEEPGPWMSGAKAGKSLASIVKLQRRIGAIELTVEGSRIFTDSEVKEGLTGDQHAKKHQVHRVLQLLGYELAPGRCKHCRKFRWPEHDEDAADAVALGHYAVSVMAQEAMAR